MTLGWFVRRVAEVDGLARFYADVFGLPLLRRTATSTQFWAGETMVFAIQPGGSPPPPYRDRGQAPCVPMFRVHGIGGTIRRLEAAGVRFVNVIEKEHNTLAYFVDPSGHITGLNDRRRTSPRPEDGAAWRRWDAGGSALPGVPPLPPDMQHLGWVVFRCRDHVATAAFCQETLGLEVAERHPTTTLLRLGGGVLLEAGTGTPPESVPSDRFEVGNVPVLRVSAIDETIAQIAAAGARVVNPPFDILHGRVAYVASPEGHLIGFQQRSATSPYVEDIAAMARG